MKKSFYLGSALLAALGLASPAFAGMGSVHMPPPPHVNIPKPCPPVPVHPVHPYAPPPQPIKWTPKPPKSGGNTGNSSSWQKQQQQQTANATVGNTSAKGGSVRNSGNSNPTINLYNNTSDSGSGSSAMLYGIGGVVIGGVVGYEVGANQPNMYAAAPMPMAPQVIRACARGFHHDQYGQCVPVVVKGAIPSPIKPATNQSAPSKPHLETVWAQ